VPGNQALFSLYGLMHWGSNAEHAAFRILEHQCSAKLAAQSAIASVKPAPKQHPASNIFRANRSSALIFLLLVCVAMFLEGYEDALCKYCIRRERRKSTPPTNKPSNVRAKALGSGVATVLVVTFN
jgi:hypothetical protein